MNALPVWDLLWILRFSRREKHFPHKAQRWGFSLVWVRMWISILYLKKKDILLYKCPQNKRASHKVFMFNRWCLLLSNHYTRNPIYGNVLNNFFWKSLRDLKLHGTITFHFGPLQHLRIEKETMMINFSVFHCLYFQNQKWFVWNAAIKDIYRKLP